MSNSGMGRRDSNIPALHEVTAETGVPWEGGRILHHWWFSARAERLMPARRDFSPKVMGRHLSGVGLCDVFWTNPARPLFRARLVGSHVASAWGRDPTGLWAEQLSRVEGLVERFTWAASMKRPYLCLKLPVTWGSKDFLFYSTLVMPLSSDGESVDMLIAHLHFHPMRL